MSKASHFAHAGGAHFAEGDFDGVGRGHCALNSPQGSIELNIFFHQETDGNRDTNVNTPIKYQVNSTQ